MNVIIYRLIWPEKSITVDIFFFAAGALCIIPTKRKRFSKNPSLQRKANTFSGLLLAICCTLIHVRSLGAVAQHVGTSFYLDSAIGNVLRWYIHINDSCVLWIGLRTKLHTKCASAMCSRLLPGSSVYLLHDVKSWVLYIHERRHTETNITHYILIEAHCFYTIKIEQFLLSRSRKIEFIFHLICNYSKISLIASGDRFHMQ